MARQRKRGLDYFPFDVDFFTDIKIRKLIKRQGGKAVTVYALLLCLIYRDGYYMRWDEELPFIISEQTGYEEAYIREVLKCCLSLGLFNADLFAGERILTSEGIQRRYLSIILTLKRKPDMDNYVLIHDEEPGISSPETRISSEEIGVSSEETGINSEETRISSGFIPTKEKEKKRNKRERSPQSPPGGRTLPPAADEGWEAEAVAVDAVRLWNEATRGSLPPVERLTARRREAIRRVAGEFGPAVFGRLFRRAAASAFLRGANAKHWRADFDWILRPENVVRVLEGSYDDVNRPAAALRPAAPDYADIIRQADDDLRRRGQQRADAVTHEQYLELRRRAEQGDPEARRLIAAPGPEAKGGRP